MENEELDLELELEEKTETEEETEEIPDGEEETPNWEEIAKQKEAEANKWRRLAQKNKSSSTIRTKPEPVDDDLRKTVNTLAMSENKRQFGSRFGLTAEETDIVYKFSGGKPTKATLEDPFIKNGLEALRTAKRVESNTPSSSTHSSVFGNKSFEEIPEADRKKAFEERMKGMKG